MTSNNPRYTLPNLTPRDSVATEDEREIADLLILTAHNLTWLAGIDHPMLNAASIREHMQLAARDMANIRDEFLHHINMG